MCMREITACAVCHFNHRMSCLNGKVDAKLPILKVGMHVLKVDLYSVTAILKVTLKRT